MSLRARACVCVCVCVCACVWVCGWGGVCVGGELQAAHHHVLVAVVAGGSAKRERGARSGLLQHKIRGGNRRLG